MTINYPCRKRINPDGVGCSYYDYAYSNLSKLSFEDALQQVDSLINIKWFSCEEYVYRTNISKRVSLIRQFGLVCSRRLHRSAWLCVLPTIGVIALPAGMLTDIYGRKPSFIFGAITTVAGSFIWQETYFFLYALRLVIMQCGLLICYLALTAIFTEVFISESRSRLTITVFMGVHLGYALAKFLSGNIQIWLHLQAACSCFTLIIFFGVMFVPESPRWYMVHEQWASAWKVLIELGSEEKNLIGENEPYPKTTMKQQIQFLHSPFFQQRAFIALVNVGFSSLAFMFSDFLQEPLDYVITSTTSMAIIQALAIVLLATCIYPRKFTCTLKTVSWVLFLLISTCIMAAGLVGKNSRAKASILVLSKMLAASLHALSYTYVQEIFPTTHRCTALGINLSFCGFLLAGCYYCRNRVVFNLPTITSHILVAGFCAICALITGSGPKTHMVIPDRKQDFYIFRNEH